EVYLKLDSPVPTSSVSSLASFGSSARLPTVLCDSGRGTCSSFASLSGSALSDRHSPPPAVPAQSRHLAVVQVLPIASAVTRPDKFFNDGAPGVAGSAGVNTVAGPTVCQNPARPCPPLPERMCLKASYALAGAIVRT